MTFHSVMLPGARACDVASADERQLARCLVKWSALMSFAFLTGPAHAQSSEDDLALRLIAQRGLIEAPQPVGQSARWRKPTRIIVLAPTPQQLRSLQSAAPGVTLVAAADAAEAARLAPAADAVLGSCNSAILDAGTDIRWIQSFNVSVDRCIALPAVRERQVLVTNMQKIGSPVIAEHVMALILSLARQLPAYADAQRAHSWRPELQDSLPAFSLEGKTLLVAGLGGIGTAVAQRAHAFGMRVIATRSSKVAAPAFVSRVGTPHDLPAMMREADIVLAALPVTSETRGVFDARMFANAKPSAYFINVGGSGTIVTADLIEALKKRVIAGAGLDVVDGAPLPSEHPLWGLPNVIITPSVATASDGGNEDYWLLARENLRRYVAGERMLSVVDLTREY